jgi:DNA/RNA-binding domain of Phe-tRNA-synthetase-like protein
MLDTPAIEVAVDASVARALALGLVVLEDVRPRAGAPSGAALTATAAALVARMPASGAHDAARRLYKAFGIDPTRYRPSSEQLARRIARGDPFPSVNPLVDAVNLCQLEERLPYGLYDLDAVEGAVVAREGRAGESYAGIRKGEVALEGKPALFDARGPFGNPTSDSDRTKTSPATRRALAVVFGAPEMTGDAWRGVLERTAARLLAHVEGREVERRVVAGARA